MATRGSLSKAATKRSSAPGRIAFMLLRWPRPKQSPAAERLSRWFLWPHESAVSSPLLCTRRVPRVLSTPYPQVKRVVGNERDAQSKQAGVLRKAAGTDEHGRDLPVTVVNARGKERTIGPDWHTNEQSGRERDSQSKQAGVLRHPPTHALAPPRRQLRASLIRPERPGSLRLAVHPPSAPRT